ncbi:MAG: outer membrane beta-barrel protein [Acidobacteria bacterium]|nr:outer membrane beta-barrel protein [Acidobacteriota bacterium]
MLKLLAIGLLLSLSAAAAFAQTTRTGSIPVTDKLGPEVFVGYSNLQAEGLPSGDQNNTFSNNLFGDRTGLHGFNSEFTYYLTRHFGLTADFSFNQRRRSFTTTVAGGTATLQNSLDTRVVNILGGPQVRFPNQTRATPFVHALFGVANTRFEAEAEQTTAGGTFTNSFTTNATDFAMALGGGLDINVSDRVALRVFQIDYNPVFLRNRSINILGQAGAIQPQRLESNRQDNIRLSFGVTIK